MITIEEFYEDLRQIMQHEVVSADIGFSAALFLQRMMENYIEDQGLVVDPNLLSFQKQGRGRCDGYYCDEIKHELTLFIVDYSHEIEIINLTNTDIDSLKNKVLLFYKSACDRRFVESIDESHDGYEMAEFINRKHSEFQKVKILIITNKRLSKSVKEVRETEHDLPLNLSYDIWDLTRFYQLEVSHGNSEAIVITIEDLKKPLAAILASSTSDITSYLVVVPGEMLANLYERFGSKLMESNVRSFLQFRAGVNKGIRKTILTEPEKFFAYNNGITVTAESVRFNDESKIIQLNNLQIVNGGQTTVSLYQTRKDRRADLSQIHVQMKLNIVGNSKVTDEIVPNISRYANSQNKISDSDFFSNHPYHRRFESQALRIWAPGSIRQSKWFYERARGSYGNAQANLTSSQKLAFQSENPKDQLITKIDLAKLYLIFNDKLNRPGFLGDLTF